MRIDPSLRPGLAFMTFHFPDEVDTNQLTIDATDPKSGTAEFKAAAIRVEKLEPAEREQRAGVAEPASVGRTELVDVHLVPGAEPTAAESAALDGRARAGPRRVGRRRAPRRARGQHRELGARGARAAPSAAARALGAAGADRLDQPRRAQRALPPADAAPGRRVRRRHVLRDARGRAAAAARRARLRGHRLPLQRLRRADRAAGGALRRRGRALRRRLDDLVSQPLPRPVRPRPRRPRRRCRRRAARADARADDGDRRARRARGRRARACAGDRAAAGGRPVAAPAAPRRLRERVSLDEYRATAATPRCDARSSSAPRA